MLSLEHLTSPVVNAILLLSGHVHGATPCDEHLARVGGPIKSRNKEPPDAARRLYREHNRATQPADGRGGVGWGGVGWGGVRWGGVGWGGVE